MTYPLGGFAAGVTSPAFLRGSLAGTVSDAYPRIRRLLNASRVADVWTFTISGVANSTVYGFTINGIYLSITSDATAVNTEIRDALIDKINGTSTAPSIVSGLCVAAATGATTFTVTSLQPGEALDVSESDANLTLAHTVTASNNSALPAGTIVSRSSDGTGCGLPAITAAVAAVKVATLGVQAAAKYRVGIRMADGTIYGPWEVTSANPAVLADDLTAIAALMNSDLPANTVAITVTDGNTTLTGTAEVAGTDFDFTFGTDTVAVTWSVATSTANVPASFTYPLVGAVRYPVMKAGGQVLADEMADVVTEANEIYLTAEDAPSSLIGTVYVRGTAGTLSTQTPGRIRFTDSDSGKCLEVTGLELNTLTPSPGTGTYSFRINRPAGP